MNYKNYDAVLNTLIGDDFDISALEVGVMQRPKRKGHDQKGWYILHEITLDDGTPVLIGSFGYWLGGEAFKEKISPGKEYKLSKEQRDLITKQHAENQKKAEAERKQAQDRAMFEAMSRWNKSKTTGECSYLARKKVQAHGVRYLSDEPDAMLLPIGDFGDKVFGLQIIRGKNKQANSLDKEFWPAGMAKKGHGHLLGTIKLTSNVVLVAEGYATAATLHEATGLPVAVAYDAGNLLPVGEALRKKHKHINLLYCADDDYLSTGNPGVSAAQKSAAATGGAHIVPQFIADREGKKLTDFNDLANFPNCSNSTVLVQIQDKLTQLGWAAQSPVKGAGARIEGGGGEAEIALSMLYPNEVVSRFSPVWSPKDVFYFDHKEKIIVEKPSITGRMRRHGWDIVQADADWQNKPEVPLRKVGFDPSETDADVIYNMWTGWPLTPKAGDCSALCDLLAYMCSKEKSAQEIYQWVLKWLAYPLQYPGAKLSTSLVFHGPQGVGKNLFFESYAKIYGEYTLVIDQEALEDKFNEHYSRKLFLIADEVVARGELFHQKNKLKGITTGNKIRINPKGTVVWYEKNQINLVYLSNEQQPIVLEEDDRRYCVVLTPEKLPIEIYQTVKNEIANGGIEAFYDYLLQLPLGDFHPHSTPPISDAKRELINISMPSELRFFRDWEAGDTEWPFCPCASSDLYTAYTRYCRKNGIPFPRDNAKFSGFAKTNMGWDKTHKSVHNSYHYESTPVRQRMILVSDKSLGEAAKRGMKDYRKTDEQSQVQWLTDCFLDFRGALNAENDGKAHGAHG
jgi:putative DNA primase/helicase